jgi:hypothetical protein
VLDRSLRQIVEDLIADEGAGAGDVRSGVEIGHIEIADAAGADLALAPELLEGLDRVAVSIAASCPTGGRPSMAKLIPARRARP